MVIGHICHRKRIGGVLTPFGAQIDKSIVGSRQSGRNGKKIAHRGMYRQQKVGEPLGMVVLQRIKVVLIILEKRRLAIG